MAKPLRNPPVPHGQRFEGQRSDTRSQSRFPKGQRLVARRDVGRCGEEQFSGAFWERLAFLVQVLGCFREGFEGMFFCFFQGRCWVLDGFGVSVDSI